MEPKELNVWGWIGMQCHMKEWRSAANVAEFLAGVDTKMWGTLRRVTWVEKQKYFDWYMKSTSFPANFLVAVARYRNIKVGCMVSSYNCDECAYAKENGKCNQTGTIMHFWQYVLFADSREEIDEELQKGMKETLDRFWLK